jgi:hypothetical protein
VKTLSCFECYKNPSSNPAKNGTDWIFNIPWSMLNLIAGFGMHFLNTSPTM